MTTYRPHPLDQGHPPEWASGWGEDKFGVFVEFTIAGATQRMRWIEPGTFTMGSPKGEPGRDADEVQHEVTLTDGFWLADTPCTQALWVGVMGSNPSNFRAPDRPVEQVSWEDCQAFCRALEEQLGDGGWRLPSEAEWEYACRAGTEMATYAGSMKIDDKSMATVLESIAWYAGNSDRQTHAVKAKAPNPWGLYDTLGNVYEWCEDWFGAYGKELSIDPRGPSRGSYRVFRGGSWDSAARNVRAAFRFLHDPSYRWDGLGFRLARGQVSALRPGGAERPAGR